MRTKGLRLLLFLTVSVFLIQTGCNENDVSSGEKGKVLFYTNAQAMINCGPGHFVKVNIENDSAGIIFEPTIEELPLPGCINSDKNLMLELEPGVYQYSAELDCGDIDWNGEFEIFRDSCTRVFLDIKSSTNYKEIGRAVFYSNAQLILDCDPWDYVYIFVENDSIGTIKESYKKDVPPECRNSNTTVSIKSKAGVYNYTARLDCGPYEWNGKLEIYPDSCTHIYLDIDKSSNQ